MRHHTARSEDGDPTVVYAAVSDGLFGARIWWTGSPEIAGRVRMRDALAQLGFIELTRGLMTSHGDDIDVQIAVFDEEMAADLKELGGTAPSSAGSAVDLAAIPLASMSINGLPPMPDSSRDRAGSSASASLVGAPKHAMDLTGKLGNALPCHAFFAASW